MASSGQREEWQAVLSRWHEARLLDDAAADAIVAWEHSRGPAKRRASLFADAGSYFGVSILLVGALLLTALAHDGGAIWWALPLPLALGTVSAGLSWWTGQADQRPLSDGFAGAAIVLVGVGVGLMLDELGNADQQALGALIVSATIALLGGGLVWLVRSPLAMMAASLAVAQMPLAIAIEGHAFDVGIYGYESSDVLDVGALWAALAAIVVVAILCYAALARIGDRMARRSGRRSGRLLEQWGQLGASLGAAAALLSLVGASPQPLFDWVALLAGWVVTAWALRSQRIELLPASALLLLGSLAGGLSDLDNAPRIGLTVVLLLTALELTALGLASPRLLGRMAAHWLTPVWESALLIGGVAAVALMADDSDVLAVVGALWAMGLLTAGVARQHRPALIFGVIGVYALGLTLVLGRFESSLGAVLGTLIFGLLVVVVAVLWRRRQRARGGAGFSGDSFDTG